MNKRLKFIILFLLILISFRAAEDYMAKADTANTAVLRIIVTGDLHGQVTSDNLETGASLPTKGLSKLATLAELKKNEVGADSSLLLDAGDFLYDYTTNYFYDNYPDDLQPILRAMSLMGYDYITLGNHEFDYPWDYLSDQLERSGLAEKVLVCNTFRHDNGKPVFSPSAVITKKLSAPDGSVIPVRIGIIGSTTNIISGRRGDYYNVIDAMDNYESIAAEADRLKKVERADAVIVLLHGGIGERNPAEPDDNIGYALTKLDTVDAVITAHSHSAFPDEKRIKDLEIPLSTVDITTGCINGKPVVTASSHADALGIIDLTFNAASDGSVKLAGGRSGIDYVTGSEKDDSRITDMFAEYKKKLQAGADLNTYSAAKGIAYYNYDTVLQDSNLYQLMNNAKISYGLTYITQHLPQFGNLPVIACTKNVLDDSSAFVLLKDNLSSEKISRVLAESSPKRPVGYIQVYKISGRALREWLEYNASIYAVQGSSFKSLLKSYVSKNPGVSTLLQEEYVYSWSSQYIFDGISYTVDLSRKARYSSGGTMISSENKRITGLTYNGTEVSDGQSFILVTDAGIPALSFLPKDREGSIIKEFKDYDTGKSLTLDYIRRMSVFGNICDKADHNWELIAKKGYTFLLGVPTAISGTVSGFSWNKGMAAQTATYTFFKGSLPSVAQNINIIAAQGRTELNNEPVPVVIAASSKCAIKEIKYLSGNVKKTSDSRWDNADVAENSRFTTSTNGVYTIRVTDKNNKSSLAYVTVDRYAADILPSPVIDMLTNRFSVFTGKAVPDSIIHVTIGTDQYFGTVKSDGTFRIEVKPAKAFSKISAYAEKSGIRSAAVTAAVRKTGPDTVQIDTVRAGDTCITGTADPYTTVYALVWPIVYVGRGQTDLYKSSDFYNASYNIAETDITVNQETGAYSISIPPIKANKKVYVFSVDRFGATSKSTMTTSIYPY